MRYRVSYEFELPDNIHRISPQTIDEWLEIETGIDTTSYPVRLPIDRYGLHAVPDTLKWSAINDDDEPEEQHPCKKVRDLTRRIENLRLAFLAEDRQEPTERDIKRIETVCRKRVREILTSTCRPQEEALS